MTVRNAVPRFGIRWAVVLAAVAAVVVAALLAVGSPASAQTSDDKEIWSATMTVGAQSGGTGRGYINVGVASDYGSLDDSTFTYDGTDYRVVIINDVAPSTLSLAVSGSRLTSTAELTWTLHIGGRTFDFNDATYIFDSGYHAYQWSLSPRFGWAASDTVAVKITEKKSISILAGPDVEYGGNNNAAESTAEFKFSRTGNTDEALTFSFTHDQSGETATRTFAAGQSSFSNFHWAIDVDESNNPVCLITWEIVGPISGYIIAAPNAVVIVEGPGTTCMGTM